MGIMKTIAKGICMFMVIFAIALLAIFITQTIDYDPDNTISTIPIVVNNTTSELTPTASTIPTSIKPTPMPTLTSTKVIIPTFPEATPTAIAIFTPTPTATPKRSWVDYGVWANIGTLEWDHEDVVYFTYIRDKHHWHCMGERVRIPKEHHVEGGAWHEDHIFLMYMKIFIDDQLIAEFKPTVVHGCTGFEVEELPMIISVPNGIDVDGEITVIGVYEFPKMHPYTNGQWHNPECDGNHPMQIDWHGASLDEDFTEWNHY